MPVQVLKLRKIYYVQQIRLILYVRDWLIHGILPAGLSETQQFKIRYVFFFVSRQPIATTVTALFSSTSQTETVVISTGLNSWQLGLIGTLCMSEKIS